jgi:hypothetical protein
MRELSSQTCAEFGCHLLESDWFVILFNPVVGGKSVYQHAKPTTTQYIAHRTFTIITVS